MSGVAGRRSEGPVYEGKGHAADGFEVELGGARRGEHDGIGGADPWQLEGRGGLHFVDLELDDAMACGLEGRRQLRAGVHAGGEDCRGGSGPQAGQLSGQLRAATLSNDLHLETGFFGGLRRSSADRGSRKTEDSLVPRSPACSTRKRAARGDVSTSHGSEVAPSSRSFVTFFQPLRSVCSASRRTGNGRKLMRLPANNALSSWQSLGVRVIRMLPLGLSRPVFTTSACR